MSEPLLYWSEAYTHAFVEALNRDAEFQQAARKFDDTLIFRCLDTKEGLDIEARYRIQKGKVSVERLAEDAPNATLRNRPFDKKICMARTTAPYALWVKLDNGEMNVLGAIRSPDYAVDGSKLKIMGNIGVLNAMSAVGAKMSKRYA
ncbi:MAG: hypothetical protein AB8I08_06300 [Sandaracinaceae bacterium]